MPNEPLIDRRTLLAALAAALALGPSHARAETLRMRDLYNKDLSFSDLAQTMENERIEVRGYMAPPLKAESRFFVLTKRPMAVCPFCETEAEWPDDILAVYTKRIIDVVPYNVPITVEGRLQLGTYEDPETGFVSRVRTVESHYARD
ncbi:hypothetical protein L0F51_17190 [Afifella sp. H1R]|uniref:hypothetical protein n=1 Tax=Afifella sp. H1R TaxID=2908841 RepID=UPI001F3059D5|nr:hypothetical protein [Afifella sp. H1R]MCF1505490.1 hypothetical protein [Afifella sp. H1R]